MMDIEVLEIAYELKRIPFVAGAMFLLRCLFCMLAEAWRVINCLKFLAGAYQRRIRFLENELKEKDAEIERLKKKAEDTTDVVEEIDKIVKQMTSLLGQNSTNSGWPSSTDGIKSFGKALQKLSRTYNALISQLFPQEETTDTTTTTIVATGLVPAGKSATGSKSANKKKPGGQAGHKGSSMNCIGMDPTGEVVHMPEKCKNCPKFEECKKKAQKKDRRMVYDVKVVIEAIAHYMGVVECPENGEVLSGAFPANVTSRFQYGSGVWALCAVLVEFGCVSINRTGQILRDAFFIPISDGSVQNAIMRGGELAIPFVNHFRKHILIGPCASFDETGRKVYPSPELVAEKEKNSKKQHKEDKEDKQNGGSGKGKKRRAITIWIHTAVNQLYTVLHPSLYRGVKGMIEGGILPFYFGNAIHDCLAAYWQFITCVHGLCVVHLQREVNKLKELDPTQAEWLDRLMSFLYRLKEKKGEIIDAWTRLREAGKIPGEDMPHATEACIKAARDEFLDIIKAGRAKNPQPYVNPDKKGRGRKKKTPFANLLDRLEGHPDDWIRFFLDFRAWENNTIAERSFRDEKISQCVSKMIRTMEGAWAQCRLKSIIDTAQKHRIPPISALFQMYEGRTPVEVFNDPLPWYAVYLDPFEPQSPFYTFPKALPAPAESTTTA